MVEVDTRRGERLAGRGPAPRILGIIETSPERPWNWRDRRFVLRGLKGTVATHYVYASEADPLLGEQWRDPFPAETLARFADLVESRVAVVGIALAPDDVVDGDDPAELAALAAKVDQVLDVGLELVVLRFDRSGPGCDPDAAARLVTALAGHVGDRADLVVVPSALTQTWPTDELTSWDRRLPGDVAVAWCGSNQLPARIGADEVAQRAAALGGRAPLVWDAYALNSPLAADRLPLGPYGGRDHEALTTSAGWLVTAPAVARATVPFLGPFSTWAEGGDPAAAWRDDAGALRVFVEACEGSVPRALVDDAVTALGSGEWWAPLGRLVEWMTEAAQVATPLLGQEVGPWRRQVRNEAALCLGLAGVIQLAHPLVLRDDDGTVRVVPPDLHLAMVGAGLLTAQWKALARRTPDVMGHRCALYPRATTTPDGAMVMGGPLLVEGGNATDRLTRAVTSWLLTVAPEDVAVTVDGTVVTEAADGAVDAPAHATVVARAGARVTAAPPGWVPPVPADGRVSTPEWSWDAEPVDQDGAR